MKYGKNGVKRVNATLTFGIQKDKLDELNLYHSNAAMRSWQERVEASRITEIPFKEH